MLKDEGDIFKEEAQEQQSCCKDEVMSEREQRDENMSCAFQNRDELGMVFKDEAADKISKCNLNLMEEDARLACEETCHNRVEEIDAESSRHSEQVASNKTIEMAVDDVLKDDHCKTSCDEEQAISVNQKQTGDVIENNILKGRDDDIADRLFDNKSNVANDEFTELIHKESEDPKAVSGHKSMTVVDPRNEIDVRKECKKNNEHPYENEILSLETQQPRNVSTSESSVIDLQQNTHGNIIVAGPVHSVSILSNDEKSIVTNDYEKKKVPDVKNGDSRELHSPLEYDDDEMMTDSQIKLLDDDMLDMVTRYHLSITVSSP